MLTALWNRAKNWMVPPIEFRHYNPLQATLKNTIVYDENVFHLRRIRVVTVELEGSIHEFTDYETTEGSIFRVAEEEDGRHLLLLKISETLKYDGEDPLDEKLLGEIEYDELWYKRIREVEHVYDAESLVLEDANKDGKLSKGESKATEIYYWDYWRESTVGEAHFVFVEMDSTNGYFTIYKGFEIPSNSLQVL